MAGSVRADERMVEEILSLANMEDHGGADGDAEAFLTTFQRVLVAPGVREDRWSYALASQLVGKAQQAGKVVMEADKMANHHEVNPVEVQRI